MFVPPVIILDRCPTLAQPQLSWLPEGETSFRRGPSLNQVLSCPGMELRQPEASTLTFCSLRGARSFSQTSRGWEEGSKTPRDPRSKTPTPACFGTSVNPAFWVLPPGKGGWLRPVALNPGCTVETPANLPKPLTPGPHPIQTRRIVLGRCWRSVSRKASWGLLTWSWD